MSGSPEQRNGEFVFKTAETPRSLIRTLSSHHKEGQIHSDSPRSLIKTLAGHHQRREFELDIPADLEQAHQKSTLNQSKSV